MDDKSLPFIHNQIRGLVHIESKIITNYTLGEFLNVWGIRLGRKIVKVTEMAKIFLTFENMC